MNRTFSIKFLVLAIVFLILLVLDIFVGSVLIEPDLFFKALFGKGGSQEISTIIFSYRMPKAVTAVCAGIALSISGLQMQTVFRNPLAGPFVLGISSGAGLGVAILVMGFSSVFSLSFFTLAGSWSLVLVAWLGAGAVLLIILLVSIRINDIMTILILGMLFASAASAIVSILQFFSNESLLKSFVIWSLGSLSGVTIRQLYVLLPTIMVGLVISLFSIKHLDLLLLGETYARTSGMNVTRIRAWVFISTSILAGTVTAFCGPIGFIGVAVPHIARLLFNTANHRILLPATALVGAAVLLLSDIIAQLPGVNATLPINSVTSLIGIPVIIYIIFKNRKIGGFA